MAEARGSYVFYDGPESRALVIDHDAAGRLSVATLGGRAVTGSVDLTTHRLRLEVPLGAQNMRPTGKRVYEGLPFIGSNGAVRVNAADHLWGWGGSYRYEYVRERVGAVHPPSGGWWARTVMGFAADIRPLFRQLDIDAMNSLAIPAQRIDLASYEAVKDKAWMIYSVLANPTPSFVMPCDGPWPDDRVALFKYWIDDGKRP